MKRDVVAFITEGLPACFGADKKRYLCSLDKLGS
jgi:hypothetical protein